LRGKLILAMLAAFNPESSVFLCAVKKRKINYARLIFSLLLCGCSLRVFENTVLRGIFVCSLKGGGCVWNIGEKAKRKETTNTKAQGEDNIKMNRRERMG
jgi:hypothetical protein